MNIDSSAPSPSRAGINEGPSTSPEAPSPTFLTAEWRHLIMASYQVEPAVLKPLVPAGTELDFFEDGRTFFSLVGLRFVNTRLLGGRVRFPCHADFPEVNLRFYVRRRGPDGAWRRGTVFVKEIVPLPAVAAVARIFYGEKYLARPMKWRLSGGDDETGPNSLEYSWKIDGTWNRLQARATGSWAEIAAGSLDEFICEHYYGYTTRLGRQGTLATLEYQVEHPRWRVRPVDAFDLDCPTATALYGAALAAAVCGPPASRFLAEGSQVTIRGGVAVPLEPTPVASF